MRSINTILLSLMLLLVSSCAQQEGPENVFTMNQPKHTAEALQQAIKDSGSVDAYHELIIANMDGEYGHPLEMAKIMADKYNYAKANYHVYYFLQRSQRLLQNNDSASYRLDKLSEADRNTALHYLQKGAAKGNEQCMQQLGEYYLRGQYVPQDSAKGKALIAGTKMGWED